MQKLFLTLLDFSQLYNGFHHEDFIMNFSQISLKKIRTLRSFLRIKGFIPLKGIGCFLCAMVSIVGCTMVSIVGQGGLAGKNSLYAQDPSPVSSFALPKPCEKAYQQARQKNFAQAFKMLKDQKCSVVRTYVQWCFLKDPENTGSFEDHYAFLKTHHQWPHLYRIRQNMEKRVPKTLSLGSLENWFSKNPPSTVEGITLYAQTLQGLGHAAKALEVLRTFWIFKTQNAQEARAFYALHEKKLREQDHWERLQEGLWEGKTCIIPEFLPLLTPLHQRLIKTRLKLQTGSLNETQVIDLINSMPESLRKNEGLLFDQLKWYRRHQEEKALDLYKTIRGHIKTHIPLWAKEKMIVVRDALVYKRYAEAYALVSHHAFKEGKFFATSEWLAGFIAYRFLKDPSTAVPHFRTLLQKVKMPTSITQAAYWGGLAQKSLKHTQAASVWFGQGAHYPMTFYGQLCCEELNRKPKDYLALHSPHSISREARKKVASQTLAQVVMMLHEQGDSQEALPFLYLLLMQATKKQEKEAVIELASRYAPLETVELVETLEHSENFMNTLGYPVLKQVPWRPGMDKALIHAIIRKESKFKPAVTSWMGAIGLMQIMPATGADIAKALKISPFSSKSLYDKNRNLAFGQYYVEDLFKTYKNLTLFLAAYNAGPGTVNRKWLKLLGDPRKGDVDLLTWIELVPFSQTRHYITKVTSNYKIFHHFFKHAAKTSR